MKGEKGKGYGSTFARLSPLGLTERGIQILFTPSYLSFLLHFFSERFFFFSARARVCARIFSGLRHTFVRLVGGCCRRPPRAECKMHISDLTSLCFPLFRARVRLRNE